MGLVVLESLSAGCIPTCYAVNYGPADTIYDGVNGFVVPVGDVDALAGAIRRFLSMPENEVQEMRRAAIRRAADLVSGRSFKRVRIKSGNSNISNMGGLLRLVTN